MYGTSGAKPTASYIAHDGFPNMVAAWTRAGHVLNKVLNAASRPLGTAAV